MLSAKYGRRAQSAKREALNTVVLRWSPTADGSHYRRCKGGCRSRPRNLPARLLDRCEIRTQGRWLSRQGTRPLSLWRWVRAGGAYRACNISASDGPLQSKPHASIQAQSKSYTRYTDSEGLPEGCQAVNHGAMPQEHGVEANWPHRYRPRSRAANLNENCLRSRCTSIVLLLDDSGHVQFLLSM